MAIQGIRLKLTVAIGLVVLITAVALMGITNVLLSLTYDLSLKARSEQTGKVLQQALDRHQQQLAVAAEATAQNSQFQQDIQWQTKDALETSLTEMQNNGRSDAAIAVNVKGEVMAEVARKGFTGQQLRDSEALKKARTDAKITFTLELLGDSAAMVVASPVQFSGQTTGFLVVAAAMDEKMLVELKAYSTADLFLLQGGKLRAATLTLARTEPLLSGAAKQLTGSGQLVPVEGILTDDGKPLLASAMTLKSGGKPVVLVFALSTQEATAIKRRVTKTGLVLTLIITVIAVFGGLIGAGTISNPIVEIEQSFRQIAASGDLSLRITKPYPDEVGRMADSFNQMQSQVQGLHARVVDAEKRMRSELQMASTVQEMLFPQTALEGPRCQFASHAQTSTETGGDWYTILHSPEHHSTTVIIADVTGHGAAAALVTAILHGFLNARRDDIALAHQGDWVAVMSLILRQLSETIALSTRRSLVLSLCVFTFDHQTLKARYLNAGHPAPIIVRHDANGRAQVGVLSTPPSSLIGDVDDPDFAHGAMQLAPDEVFVLYTDGLIECTNDAQEEYGLKRLRGVLSRNAQVDARTLRDIIFSEMSTFIGNTPPADDITYVVGKVGGG